ncbi:hypothetical protein [Streptomyces sp. V2]|uniref:hypothetical protein n=1 Tax=Streptomyces sp. V2 TaxID=1424099 RepID=UPI0014038D79|nr:hypothetical protein [Streptomyces sp. V2]
MTPVPEVVAEVVAEPEPVRVVPVVPVAPVVPAVPVVPAPEPAPGPVPVIPVTPVVPVTPVAPPAPDPLPLVPPLPQSYGPYDPQPSAPAPTPAATPAPTPRPDRNLPYRTRRLGRLGKYSSPDWWRQRPTREAPGLVLTRLTGLDRLSDDTLCGELARPGLSPRTAQEILRALERRTRWRTFGEAVTLAGTVFGHGMFLRSEWRAELTEEDPRHGGVAGAVRMFRWAVLPYLCRPELAARVAGMLDSLAKEQPPEVREFWRRALFEQDPAPELPAVLWRELARNRPWEERRATDPEYRATDPAYRATDPAYRATGPAALRVPPQSSPVTTPVPPTSFTPAAPVTPSTHRTPSPPDDTAKVVTFALVLLTLFVLLVLLLGR